MPAEFLESSLLRAAGFRHAFFTRGGGVSEGPYRSLNFSIAVGDDAASVAQNVALAADALGIASQRLFFLSQVHGAETHMLLGDETREDVLGLEGDAIASRAPGLACGVRTADCVPILAADLRSGAVIAVHAGWRGVVAGVVEAGVARLRELAGEGSELAAAIGPHIRARAFEVSEDVALELERASPVAGVVERGGTKPHVSLARIVIGKLTALGVPNERIDDVGGCTLEEADRFFSFRRDGRTSGRLLSAIVPRG